MVCRTPPPNVGLREKNSLGQTFKITIEAVKVLRLPGRRGGGDWPLG